jgi:predicted Rossmann fold flavoprotein
MAPDSVTHHPSELPLVVVGAGAAGLVATIFAAAAGRGPVLLLERTKDGGRKILISGGGRCNVLPSRMDPAQYVTASSPATLRNILRAWPLDEQRRWFEEELGIELVLEPETGKLFPAGNRARDVRDALVARARALGAEVRFDTHATDVTPAAEPPWIVSTTTASIPARAVILATGGLSVPNTGSDGTGLAVAEKLGHLMHPTYPALTPLTADPAPHAALSGVSLTATVRAPLGGKKRFETTDGFLFTHRGYSGPSVLDVSHLAERTRLDGNGRQPVLVQWTGLGEAEWEAALGDGGTGTVANQLRRRLPDRLADALLAESGVGTDVTLSHLRRDDRRRLVELLTRYPLPWTGDEGYRKAEVTGGGVALGEVNPRTMESRRHPGLFLCGEMLDAFGPIGGYNFLWAWVTGRLAGEGAA